MNIIETLLWNTIYWTLYLPLSFVLAPEANTAILIGIGAFCSIIFTAIIARQPGIIMPRKTTTQNQESTLQLIHEENQETTKKRRARNKEKIEQPTEVEPYANQEKPTTPINRMAQTGMPASNNPELPAHPADSRNSISTDSNTATIE